MFVPSHYGQQTHGSAEKLTDSHDGALLGSLGACYPMRTLKLSAIVLLPVGLRLINVVLGFLAC